MRDLRFLEIFILGAVQEEDLGVFQTNHTTSKIIKSGMNGVAMARNGLIFGEDGATGSGRVSGCLRGLRDSM